MKFKVLIITENPYKPSTILQVNTCKIILEKYFIDTEINVITYTESSEISAINNQIKEQLVIDSILKAYIYDLSKSDVLEDNDIVITLNYKTNKKLKEICNKKMLQNLKKIINLNLDEECDETDSVMSSLISQLVYKYPKTPHYSPTSVKEQDPSWFAEKYEDIAIIFTEILSDHIEKLHKRGSHVETGNSLTPTFSSVLLNATPTIMMCCMFPEKIKELIDGYEIYLNTSKDIKWTDFDKKKIINALKSEFLKDA